MLSGQEVAEREKEEIRGAVSILPRVPKLAVIMVGDNPASQSYVRGKEKDCIECGIDCEIHQFNDGMTQGELCRVIQDLNCRIDVDGILVQLPLPKHIDKTAVIEQISPDKDVDCFRAENFGKLALGYPTFMPCTPLGVIDLLNAYHIEIAGKNCVIIGRSDIVGKPMASLLINKGGTVTVCHSKTKDVSMHTRNADLIICAVGKPGFLTADMVKDGVVVVDVGINRGKDGRLCGDVDFASVSKKCSAITPVPGGVGLMTRSALLKNVVKACAMKNVSNYTSD